MEHVGETVFKVISITVDVMSPCVSLTDYDLLVANTSYNNNNNDHNVVGKWRKLQH